VQRALNLFRELVELQPRNPRAHLGVADCLMLLGHVGFGMFPTCKALPKAKAAVKRALDLAQDDSTMAAALTTSALITMVFDWNFSDAETHFSEAVALDPNYSTAHHWRAHLFLYTMRLSEALDEIRTADQLAVDAPMVHGTVGWFLYFMNRAEEAITVNKETVKLHDKFPSGYLMLGLAYEAVGRYNEAIEAFDTSLSFDYRPTPLAAAAHTYAVWGKRRKAEQALNRLLVLGKTTIVSPYFPALVYTGLGDLDRALSLLEQARRKRCDWLVQLGVDPRWKPLHDRRRFTRLMGRVGLPPLPSPLF